MSPYPRIIYAQLVFGSKKPHSRFNYSKFHDSFSRAISEAHQAIFNQKNKEENPISRFINFPIFHFIYICYCLNPFTIISLPIIKTKHLLAALIKIHEACKLIIQVNCFIHGK